MVLGALVASHALGGGLAAAQDSGVSEAQHPSFEAELRVLGGYDSNPTLARESAERRGGGPPAADDSVALGHTAVAIGESSFVGTVGGRYFGRARIDLAGTYLSVGERWLDARGRLEAGVAGAIGTALLSLSAARYVASFGSDDASRLSGRLRGVLGLGPRLALGAHGAWTMRDYDLGGQRDHQLGAGLDLTYFVPRLHLVIGADIDRRLSNEPLAERLEFAPFVGASFRADALRIDLRYDAYVRLFDGSERDGHEHIVSLAAQYKLTRWLSALARVSVGVGRGPQDEALVYERYAASFGLRVVLGVSPATPLEALESETGPDGPATLVAEGVRFRVRYPDASSVAVIGEFNDWDPTRGALVEGDDGWFEAVLAVPPGRHRYHLLVDGEPRRPEGARRYVDDGFGGQDAIVEGPRGVD